MLLTCDYRDDLDITLAQDGPDNFTVTYGKQVRSGLTYAQAAYEYGCCVMHALACEGVLDNSDKE